MGRRKSSVNVDALDFRIILQEAVACSRLGRTIASFGAILTGREKHDAHLVYAMLRAGKPVPDRIPVTASISSERNQKKYSPSEAIKWFAENYPRDAEPLLARTNETYEKGENFVCYGVQRGRDLSDEHYIKVLVDILEIPEQDAAVMFHGSIKPQFERVKEEEGLVRLAMK